MLSLTDHFIMASVDNHWLCQVWFAKNETPQSLPLCISTAIYPGI